MLKNSLEIIIINSRVKGQQGNNGTGNRKGSVYFKMWSHYQFVNGKDIITLSPYISVSGTISQGNSTKEMYIK